MSVIGIDPGATGALAEYDPATGHLDIQDMPTWYMALKGGKTRRRVDAPELYEYFETKKLMGAELVLIEEVGGRPGQSAANGFAFGYTAGLIFMACVAVKLPVETVPPGVWKKIMRVPGKKNSKGEKAELARLMGKMPKSQKEIDASITARADELFPHHKDLWRGPKGGFRIDRCEAAMLARYAADYAMKISPARPTDVEFKLAYRIADLGA